MAIDNQFGKGIGLAAGFDLGAQKPLDARVAVNTIAERDAHVENNRAYEGMIVYVAETGKNYQLLNKNQGVENADVVLEWVELLKDEQDRIAALEAELNGEGEGGGTLATLQENIDAVQDNLDQAIEDLEGAMETEADRVNKKIADDIATESALRQQAESDLQDAIDAVNNRLEQNGDIEGRIAQAEADIDGLQGLVGHPVQAGEGEGEDVPATGLHLALDNAKAELEQAILDEKGRAEGQEAAIRQKLADEAAEIRGEMAAELGNYTVEAGEGVDAKEASGLRKEIEDAHAAIRQELADEKANLQAEIDADVKVEKERAEGVEAAIRGEMATEAARVNQKIADDIAAESALRVAEEQRIEGKVDAEAQRADAEEKRIVGLVEAEAERAEGKEGELLAAINKEVEDRGTAVSGVQGEVDALEQVVAKMKDVNEEGSLAKQIADEATARLEKDNNLEGRVAANEAFVAAQPAIDQEQDRRIKALEDANAEGGAMAEAVAAAQKAADDAQDAADKAQGEVDALEGVVSSLDAAYKAADVTLQGEVDAVEQALADEKDDTKEGSLAKKIADEIARADAEEKDIRADFAAADAGLQANIDKKVDQTAYNAKVQELVAEDTRIAGLVATEEGRAKGAEEALAGRLDVIEGEGKGSVKKALADAKSYTDGKVSEINNAASTLEGRVAANEDAIAVINGTGKGSIKKAVADLVDGAPEALDTLNELAAALRDNAGVLDAVEEAFDNKLATLQADVDQNEADCDAAIKAEKERAEGQEAAIRSEFAAADTALHTTISAEIDADVKAEADRAKAEEADIRADFAAADATLKSDLQAEIDADVKVVADELAKQKDAAQEGTLANQIADEVARADAEEKAIRQLVADEKLALQGEIDADVKVEKERAEGVEQGLQSAIDSINNETTGVLAQAKAHANGLDQAMDSRMDVVEKFVEDHDHEAMEGRIEALENANKEDGAVASAIKAAQETADQAQSEVDAVEGRMTTAEGEIDALQAFMNGHSHDQMEADISANATAIETEKQRAEGQEAAIRGELSAAIAKEVGDRDAAIKVEADRAKAEEVDIRADFAQADADLHAVIKGEMAAVIQSLVAEITEDGMLRIALGGIQGDDVLVIREQEIPFVTDAEIDEIIAGLDAVEGE